MPPIRCIVVPHDFSKASRRLLELAVRAARALQAELVLVHVIPRRDVQAIATAINRNLVVEREVHPEAAVRQFKQERLERLQEAAREAASAEVFRKALVRVGWTWSELLAVVESEEADLVLMTHHGRGPLRSLLQEDDVERLLQRCPVPVLLVRAEGSG